MTKKTLMMRKRLDRRLADGARSVLGSLGRSQSSALTLAAREARQAEAADAGKSMPRVWRLDHPAQ